MINCCICGEQTNFGYNYLCKKHWEMYKNDLREPWLRFLIANEIRERKVLARENRETLLSQLEDIEDRGN